VHAALASSAVTQAVTPASAPLPAGHGT
jgi:hypothetical protein